MHETLMLTIGFNRKRKVFLKKSF